jgi:hypothetical protein
MECVNNLKTLALAAANFHDANGYLASNPDNHDDRIGTTQLFCLPYLE